MERLQYMPADADRLQGALLTVVLLACMLISQPALAVPARISNGELDRLVPRLMDEADIPGMAVVVLSDGRVSYVGNFGVASRADGSAVQRDTRFFAASLSKPLFAFAVLRLASRGELDIDRPLCEYLENPRLEHDPRYRLITARMVLCHTSGMPNWAEGGRLELGFEPGSGWDYSGEGYIYLQKVVEQLSGRDLQDFMQAEIFGPLGMRNSSFVAEGRVAGQLVSGHDLLGRPTGRTLPNRRSMNAAGTLLTTAEDYGRFIEALLRREGIDSKFASFMSTAQTRPTGFFGGDNDDSVYWGLGFGIEAGEHGNNIWQWGDNIDCRSFVMVDVHGGDGIILLSNSENGLSVAERLTQSVLSGPHPAFDWLPFAASDDPRFIARRDLEEDYFLNEGRNAQRIYDRAQRDLDPTALTELVVSTGKHLVRDGLPQRAISLLKMHVSGNPRDPGAHDLLASFHLSTGNAREALAELQASAKLDPGNRERNAKIAQLQRQI